MAARTADRPDQSCLPFDSAGKANGRPLAVKVRPSREIEFHAVELVSRLVEIRRTWLGLKHPINVARPATSLVTGRQKSRPEGLEIACAGGNSSSLPESALARENLAVVLNVQAECADIFAVGSYGNRHAHGGALK